MLHSLHSLCFNFFLCFCQVTFLRRAAAFDHNLVPLLLLKLFFWNSESRFELFGSKRGTTVWSNAKEQLLNNNITLWFGGVLREVELEILALIDGKMTTDTFIGILLKNLEESVLKCCVEDYIILAE